MQDFKREFGEDLYKTGIYKISTLYDSSLFYVGMTGKVGKFNSNSGFNYRWNRHLYDLSKKKHSNPFLQRIYNKYGINSLKFEIIEFCNFNECIEKEILMIEILKPPLNLHKNKYCRTNYKVSYKTRQKISKANTGRKNSEETKLKMSLANNRIQYRYIDGIKRNINDIITIEDKILEEIKFLILNKKYTKNKIFMTYYISPNKIIRNLNLYFKDSNLISVMENNKPNYLPRFVYSKMKDSKIINKVLNLYRNGILIKDIVKEISLNSDDIGVIIKNNMKEDERKYIRSQNAKRK